MATITYTKVEAKAADRVLATLTEALYKANAVLDRAIDLVHGSAGDTKSRRDGWKMSLTEALPVASDNNVNRYLAAAAEVTAAHNAIAAHEEANYKGWSRFFLVSGGHIHNSTHCHTLRLTTQIGWLPELSGETEAEAVAAHGALLCTVCFPSAPIEWTNGRKAGDDANCAGSGTWDYPRETARMGYCSGNYGVCSHCHEPITISSTGKMRKHKKGA